MLYYMNFYSATQGKTVSMPIYAGNRPKAESEAEYLAVKLRIDSYSLEECERESILLQEQAM